MKYTRVSGQYANYIKCRRRRYFAFILSRRSVYWIFISSRSFETEDGRNGKKIHFVVPKDLCRDTIFQHFQQLCLFISHFLDLVMSVWFYVFCLLNCKCFLLFLSRTQLSGDTRWPVEADSWHTSSDCAFVFAFLYLRFLYLRFLFVVLDALASSEIGVFLFLYLWTVAWWH